jgi:pimeloyl-ACP methyl ester carboxylesterase
MERALALTLALAAASCARPVDPPCTPTSRPLVAAHGFLASGDTWASLALRFASNGQCFERVRAFDWNTLGDQAAAVTALDAFVDEARRASGFDQVDLAGHSAGGGLGYAYLADPARAKKVARYVHVGSFKQDALPGPEGARVPTLNLHSDADLVVRERGDIPDATNVRFTDLDHYAVATDARVFEAVATFLDGRPPATTAVAPAEAVRLSGKVLQLGTNTPVAGGTVEIHELDEDGGREDDEPAARFTTRADGGWGPYDALPGVRYELVARDVATDGLPIHYYREPFQRSNDLVYLRTLPPASSLAGALLAGLNYDDAHAITIVFLANRALLAGRDTLTVDGRALPLDTLATAEKTAIALFLDDGDGDGRSSLAPLPSLSSFPFLGGADVMIDAATPRLYDVRLGDRTLRLRNWRSASEGVSVAVFE